MSFKSGLLYNMDYIAKEIDDVETEDLIEIGKDVKKVYGLLLEEINYRKSLKTKF